MGLVKDTESILKRIVKIVKQIVGVVKERVEQIVRVVKERETEKRKKNKKSLKWRPSLFVNMRTAIIVFFTTVKAFVHLLS